eukprot:31178-Pelagococcus_subviridis.AAC.12
MPRRLREYEVVEVEINHLRGHSQELIQLLDLVRVAQVHELQRPHFALRGGEQRGGGLRARLGVFVLRRGRAARVRRDDRARGADGGRRRFQGRARATRGGGGFFARFAADAAAGVANKVGPLFRARALPLRPGFRLQLLEEAPENLPEIAAAQTLVAVRADRQTDDDVRVRKLVRLRRDLHVLRGQQPVRHAVDLGQHVRQQRREPIAREVDHLKALVLGFFFDDARGVRGALSPAQVRVHVMIRDPSRGAVDPEPQLRPLRE